MHFPSIKQNNSFKTQLEEIISSVFAVPTVQVTKRVLKKYNTCVIALLEFYENRKTIILKVLGSVIYLIIIKYVCADYLCIQQVLLSLKNKLFQNITFNYISGIFIPVLLMNIMSCRGFLKEYNATVILKCRMKLVSYYLSNKFVVINENQMP